MSRSLAQRLSRLDAPRRIEAMELVVCIFAGQDRDGDQRLAGAMIRRLSVDAGSGDWIAQRPSETEAAFWARLVAMTPER